MQTFTCTYQFLQNTNVVVLMKNIDAIFSANLIRPFSHLPSSRNGRIFSLFFRGGGGG